MVEQKINRREDSKQRKIAERRFTIVSIGEIAKKELRKREIPTNKENILKYVLKIKETDFLWKSLLNEASELKRKELLGLISKYNEEGVENPSKTALEEIDKKYFEIDTKRDPNKSYLFLDVFFPASK